jgi:proline dehydrogenase
MPSLRALARACLPPVYRFLSRAYVVGPRLRDGLAVVDRLSKRGRGATLGYFDETGESPRRVADHSLACLDALARRPGRRADYVSVKAPALRFDPNLLIEIARKSRRTGVPIHFDSHELAAASRTMAAAELALRERAPQVGITLPGRWQRSLFDADCAVALRLRVRVVKGEWADPACPDADRSAGFLAVIDRLAGRAPSVAVATHDVDLAREALRRLQAAGTPCTLELLYGLPMRASLALARKAGVPVRVYVPFGNPWMPYVIAEVRRKPGTLWWMVKDALAIHLP